MGASAEDLALFGEDEPKKRARAPAKASAEDLALFAEPTPERSRVSATATSRIPLPGMRPEPKSDVDLGIESPAIGPQAVPRLNPLREAFPRATARTHAEDPIVNDPLAAAIVQGIPAAGAAALVGGGAAAMGAGRTLSQVLGGAAGGAASNPEDPLTGAVVGGALPLAGPAMRAADNAVGRTAQFAVDHPAIVTRPIQAAGGAMGAGMGAATAGAPGAVAGSYLGKKAGDILARRASSSIQGTAERYAARKTFALQNEGGGSVRDYMNLEPQPLAPEPAAAGAAPDPVPLPPPPPPAGTNVAEALDGPLRLAPAGTGLGNGARAAPAARATALEPLTAAKVARDARAIRDSEGSFGPASVTRETAERAPKPADVAGDLQASIKILSQLRDARAAGKLTPAMAQQAIDAGVPAALVRRVAGLP